MRDAIRAGRLPAGERLPSSRDLARQLGLSRGLVQECYGQLQAEGYLTGVVGSGTRVATGAATLAPPQPAPPTPAPTPRPPLRIDFASGVPDLSAFPREDWAWAVREACRTVAVADLDYGDPRGDPRLREVLAGYAGRVRAAVTDRDRVLVCSGFAQGAALVLRTLSRAGYHRIALEDPGNGDPARSVSSRAAQRVGGELQHVPVDGHGVDVDALAASGAQVVVVTPAHQSPTGVVLTAERRHALVAWARATDGFIVEDDYDSEFRYDRDPVGVLQGLAPERVFTVGTVSKSLAPTIRVGWVLVPPAFAAALAEEKLLADRGAPGLDQRALALLVESGRFDRHLRRMRARYTRRRTALVVGARPARPRGAAHRAGRRVPRRGPPAGRGRRAARRRGSRPARGRPPRHERVPGARRHHPAAARARVRQPRRPGGGRGHRDGGRPPGAVIPLR